MEKIDDEAILKAKHVKPLVQSLITEVAKHVAQQLQPLLQRIEQLEASVPEYTGVHEVGRAYRRNQLVTHGGSMWICLSATTSQPPGDAWMLAVKKGRDGKDGRDRFSEPAPTLTRLQ